jgi:SEC-C motif-containing protein
MRSRYTAFVRGDAPWLLATWHASTRPARLDLEEGIKWLGLKVVRVKQGEAGAGAGVVEFIARFRQGGGTAGRLHESSRFTFEAGRWYYVDGEVTPKG